MHVKRKKQAYFKKYEMSTKLGLQSSHTSQLMSVTFKVLQRLMIFFSRTFKIIFDSDEMLTFNEFIQLVPFGERID